VKKPKSYGFLFISIMLITIFFIAFAAQPVYASQTEKEEAIEAADRAIRFLPQPENIMFPSPNLEDAIAEAQDLVNTAKNVYGATDDDFADLEKLQAVKEQTAKRKAVMDARAAIDALPPPLMITEADRAAVQEARRLVDRAIEVYGATRGDICRRVDRLEDAEERIDEPTPPTGGFAIPGLFGALLTGTGLLFTFKLRKKQK